MNATENRERSIVQTMWSEFRDVMLLSLFATIGIWLSIPELQTIPLMALTFVGATVLIYGLLWTLFFRYH